MSGEVIVPASSDDRLARIAAVHHKGVDDSGGTWGDCNECGWAWPCPTRQWASAKAGSVDTNCTWDLNDCQFEHEHEDAS